jgi:hypothetical protein
VAASDGRVLWSRNGPVNGHDDAALTAADATTVYVAKWVWEGGTSTTYDWGVEAYEVTTGRRLWTRRGTEHDGTDQVPMAIAARDGRVIVVGAGGTGESCKQPRVDVLSARGELLRRSSPDGLLCGELWNVAISPDGRYAGVVGYQNELPALPLCLVGFVDLRDARRPVEWRRDPGIGAGSDAEVLAWNGNELLVGQDSYLEPWVWQAAGTAQVHTNGSVPEVVAYRPGEEGASWRFRVLDKTTRFGWVQAMAIRADRSVVYIGGSEGTPDGFLMTAAVQSMNPYGISEAYVRAIDLRTHKQLWVGRQPIDANQPGLTSSEVQGLVAVDEGALAFGSTRRTSMYTVPFRWTYSEGQLQLFR